MAVAVDAVRLGRRRQGDQVRLQRHKPSEVFGYIAELSG